jgi:hypothetical protein
VGEEEENTLERIEHKLDRLMQHQEERQERIMATFDEVKASEDALKVAVESAAARVIATINDLKGQIEAGSAVTPEQLDLLLQDSTVTTAEADAIDPSAPPVA